MDQTAQQLAALQDDERVRRLRRTRETFEDDPYLPQYHFVPPGGILHDPNGACYWNGRYHLFYQYWPTTQTDDRPWNEAMHWGHAVSDDLLHWEDLPVALSPDTGPEESCYSGQALVEDDRVVLMYHGPGAGNCIAMSSDPLLVEFDKHPENPVIPLDEDDPNAIFDPEIWVDGDTYYSLSGTYTDGTRGEDCHVIEHLFRSDDLETWVALGPLVEDEFYTEPGEDGAVPNFFPIEDTDKHMLLFFSHSHGPQYYVGTYDDESYRFEIESHARMNFGTTSHGNLHAPSSLFSPDGRRIAFFNVNAQTKDFRTDPTTGWTETVSLPRVIDLKDGVVTINPVDELETLRGAYQHVEPREIPANNPLRLKGTGGSSIEIDATIDVRSAQEVGLNVLQSPDGEEETTVSYRPAVDALGIDTSRSTLRSDVIGRTPEIGPLALENDERLDLRIFVDRSIVEVFANGRQCLTARVFPERPDSTGLSLFVRRGSARLVSMDVWQMGSIWE